MKGVIASVIDKSGKIEFKLNGRTMIVDFYEADTFVEGELAT